MFFTNNILASSIVFLIVMAIYEVESWKVKPGREKEHEEALRNWMAWVKSHKELFPEWKSLRYVTKYIAGEETERHGGHDQIKGDPTYAGDHEEN